MRLDRVARAAAEAGLVLRGAFHPQVADAVPSLPGGAAVATLVLFGFTGNQGWPCFAAAPEFTDGKADPLDRWSRRVLAQLGAEHGATPLYPFGRPPFLPFLAWAERAAPVYRSPLGMLIHPDWGLWHSYRGALAFAEALTLPPRDARNSPCESCRDRPCLGACPVGAFSAEGYAVETCATHLEGPAGTACLDRGCLARRACPIGAAVQPKAAQAAFHMAAFVRRK